MNTSAVDAQQRATIEQGYGQLGPYDVEVTDGIDIEADDGVLLRGTLALPVGLGRVPAVLLRTPYPVAYFTGEVITWASHGYACLIQSTRTTTSYFDETRDGPAAVRWIERQPWFDGRLGLTGLSYLAFTSWATASTRPASLKAIATGIYSTDRVSSWYPGGGFGLELALTWAANQQADGAETGTDPYDHLPLCEADVAATGATLDFYQERLAFDGDDPHWQSLNFAHLLDDPPAPVLHIDGWHDYHRIYVWQDFERLNRNGRSLPHRFVIGPWSHAGIDLKEMMAEKLAWFERHVRGEGSLHAGSLRYYRTGVAAEWRELDAWQEPERISLYAAADGSLATAPGESRGRAQWTYDPAHPTPSVELTALGTGEIGGVVDNSAYESRSDVLTFTGAPLEADLDLAGHVSALATFSSDAPSADLFLRLVDVYEDGRVQHVADGFVRITDSDLGWGVPVEVDLGPVGHRFGAGHRLRLLIASGAHPYHNRNLGNGEPTGTATRIRVAHQGVDVGGETGLLISLPLAR
ncbi:CocE/NonD family hydrolase [Microbacterium sp.]|uniref:CocE/NonD family hydrolase n=1 Tax=Microbacterium sp. TaxID=51671 RepID=UPI00092A4703|nr:CocE/NonD family hydrolase [Microbacterium sp.]MBN9193876.1 CocE/NonD family hydrolase [Microbacterium sp.]OJU70099.1 MAG: hypothetical protein BGO04_05275 [Microbacterium sp. 70-38]